MSRPSVYACPDVLYYIARRVSRRRALNARHVEVDTPSLSPAGQPRKSSAMSDAFNPFNLTAQITSSSELITTLRSYDAKPPDPLATLVMVSDDRCHLLYPATEVRLILQAAYRGGVFSSGPLAKLRYKVDGEFCDLAGFLNELGRVTSDNLLEPKAGRTAVQRLVAALKQLHDYGDSTDEVDPSVPRSRQKRLQTCRIIAEVADATWPTKLNRGGWPSEVARRVSEQLQRGAVSTRMIRRRLNEMAAMPLYRDRTWLTHAKSVGARSGHGGDEDAPLSTEIERHAVANRRGQRTDSMARLRR